MSLAKLCILGALMEKPMHGYEMKRFFELSKGVFWMINFGSIYPTLKKLEEAGLVKSRKELSKTVGKIIYEITEEGRNEFVRILKSRIKKEPHVRDEFTLHLFLLDYLDDGVEKSLFEEKLKGNVDLLDELLKTRTECKESLPRFKLAALERGIMHAETEIKWLNKILEEWK
jgi:DNA-binding PadR family transcriptional regulator